MRKINNQQEQLKKDSIRKQNRLRQQKARERRRKSARKLTEESVTVEKKKTSFSSKMQKSRMKSKLKQIIPESPTRTRKAELLISLANSPQTKNAIQNNNLNISLNASQMKVMQLTGNLWKVLRKHSVSLKANAKA